MALRFAGESASHVATGEEAGHRDVAAEEVIANGDDPGPKACDQRFENPGAVFARDDAYGGIGPRQQLHSARGGPARPVASRGPPVDGLEDPAVAARHVVRPAPERSLEG